MASFRYRSDRRQARVRRNGYPDETKSFKTRLEAEKWARSVETDMDRGQFASIDEAQRSTLGDLIKRYLSEVTPQMRGGIGRHNPALSHHAQTYCMLEHGEPECSPNWGCSDVRFKEVSSGTFIRELAYLSAVINHARREWGINVLNPV